MGDGRPTPIEPARRRPSSAAPGPAGRTPPHNLQAEESLLGAMLLSRDAIVAALDVTDAADFYRPAHGHVFAAIRSLRVRGEGADPVTVADELGRSGLLDAVGGLGALLSLQANTPATSNAGRYAHIVADHARLRRLIDAAADITQIAYGLPDDVEAAFADAARLVADAGPPPARGRLATVADALPAWLDSIEARQGGGRAAGEPTGWRAVDDLIVGLRAGQLVIVGGRPGQGKSDHLIGLSASLALRAVPVMLATLEMSGEEVMDRVMGQVAQVWRDKIRRGTIDEPSWMRLSHHVGRIEGAPLWIMDDPGATLAAIRLAAERVARTAGRPPVVVVDYLQLVSPSRKSENRQVDVAELSRGLKRMAGDLRTPVVAASQVRRDVDSRADKHPLLADLRETGSLEADADVVALLYRPEVYDAATDRRGEIDVIVAKQRNGPTGTARLLYDARTGRMRDRPDEDRAEPLAMNLDDDRSG